MGKKEPESKDKSKTGCKNKSKASDKMSARRKEREDSMLSNYWYFYKGWFKLSKKYLLYMILALTGRVMLLYVDLYIPKIAVSLVMEQVSMQRLVGTLAAVGLLHFLVVEMNSFGSGMLNVPCHKYRHALQEKILYKMCHTAYSDLENPDYKMMIERAKQLYEHWDRDVMQCVFVSMDFMYLMITIPITMGMLATLHPVVVLALAAGTWLQYKLGQRSLSWEKKHRDFWQPLEMRIDYIAKKFIDFSYAKELRLYAAYDWLLPKYRKLLRERAQWKGKQLKQGLGVSALWLTVETASQAVVYAFLITGVLGGRIGADDFVLYVGLALSLSNALSNVAMRAKAVKENVLSISDYRKMMGMPDSRRRGLAAESVAKPVEGLTLAGSGLESRNFKGKQADSTERLTAAEDGLENGSFKGKQADPTEEIRAAGQENSAPEITFSHVSFSYPGAGECTLKDINLTIHPEEKIALVGLNGAGKTTLIKLLCGMYEPAEGEILLNGQPAARWELEEWYRLFSVVFQDIGVIPASIAENVASCPMEDLDRERVKKCLEQAGLWQLVERLPRGMDTCLQKEMFREGVNLSGGETQKLLLARAIYREAPILVLDEPTAALDAVAENQLYLKYHELTRGRTSLFISHRLSSTRFCDRILMLEDGRIIEEGSHEELLEKQGAYYELFQVQSYYYQKDRAEGFSSDMDPSWEVSGYVSD